MVTRLSCTIWTIIADHYGKPISRFEICCRHSHSRFKSIIYRGILKSATNFLPRSTSKFIRCIKEKKGQYGRKSAVYKKHRCHVFIRKANKCVHYPRPYPPINALPFKREIITKIAPISLYG